MKHLPWRAFAAAAIVALGVCFVVGMYVLGLDDKNAAERDFISYWAAGQQLVHAANPYDFAAVRNLELAAARDPSEPLLMMRNLPVALFLVYPLGLVTAKTGLVLWLLTLLACLSISVWLLWILNGRPDTRYHLFGYLFAPALACMMAGQLGIFLLLGVVLFLFLYQSRPLLSGAALLLCSLKPHLLLPFAVVLFLWIVWSRAYRILLGFAAALAASLALSYCIDVHAWQQYSLMMRAGGAVNEAVPVLSVTFRNLLDRNAVALQFLPQTCACLWGIWYFWTRRTRWNWMDHGLVLLLVSVLCTPFGWFFDETILLPAILAGVYCAVAARRSLWPLALFAGVAAAELLAHVQATSPFYLWTTPAWLAWYLYATGRFGIRASQPRAKRCAIDG
ncbi:MAG: glycosyltransferase 87 family protein [Terracidiphilus sp.]|jgi:hypothetical protein